MFQTYHFKLLNMFYFACRYLNGSSGIHTFNRFLWPQQVQPKPHHVQYLVGVPHLRLKHHNLLCLHIKLFFLFKKGTTSDDLLYVNVPVIGFDNCVNILGTSITTGMICAGYKEGGQDACQVSMMNYLYHTQLIAILTHQCSV